MSMCAIIPVENLFSANATLEAAGFGQNNFSVSAYAGPGATHAALHAWDDVAFEAAVQAIPGVVVDIGSGDPVTRSQALITAQGAQWGDQAPALPTSGNALANTLYRYDDTLWWCIQTFSRTTYNAHPNTYPALIRRVRNPQAVESWQQPIDQYDSYRALNPFTGQPDQATHNGQTWYVTGVDGSGNNVWEPGTYGWTVVGQEPGPSETWVDTGVTIAQLIGAGVYRVSGVPTITLNQAIRLGDLQAGETVFTGYWPTTGTPSDYIKISPHVTAAIGAKVWKWA
jgi:hypothetical protein